MAALGGEIKVVLTLDTNGYNISAITEGVTGQLKWLPEEMGTPIKRAVVIDNGKLDRDGTEMG